MKIMKRNHHQIKRTNMPDYNYEYDCDPIDWKSEREEEEEMYWQQQEEYWERYRQWQKRKTEEEEQLDPGVWVFIIIVAILMLCGSMMLAM